MKLKMSVKKILLIFVIAFFSIIMLWNLACAFGYVREGMTNDKKETTNDDEEEVEKDEETDENDESEKDEDSETSDDEVKDDDKSEKE